MMNNLEEKLEIMKWLHEQGLEPQWSRYLDNSSIKTSKKSDGTISRECEAMSKKLYKLSKSLEAEKDYQNNRLVLYPRWMGLTSGISLPKTAIRALLKMLLAEFPDEVVSFLNPKIKLERKGKND